MHYNLDYSSRFFFFFFIFFSCFRQLVFQKHYIKVLCCYFFHFTCIPMISTSAGFSSISLLQINQSALEGVWKALHGFPGLLQSSGLLWCIGLCKEQVSTNTIYLVRSLVHRKSVSDNGFVFIWGESLPHFSLSFT